MKQMQWAFSSSFNTFQATALSYETGLPMLDRQIPPWRHMKPCKKKANPSSEWRRQKCRRSDPISGKEDHHSYFLEVAVALLKSLKDKSQINYRMLFHDFSLHFIFYPYSFAKDAYSRIKRATSDARRFHLLHYLGEFRAESLSSTVVENLFQGNVLQRNQGRFQHVKSCLVSKRENRRCLQTRTIATNMRLWKNYLGKGVKKTC